MNLYDELIEQKALCLLQSMKNVSFNIQIDDFYYEMHKKIYKAFLDGVFDLSAETDALKYGVDQLAFFRCLETNEFSFSSLKPLEAKISELATRRRKVEEAQETIRNMEDPTFEVAGEAGIRAKSKDEMRESIEDKWKNRTRLALSQFERLGDKIYSFDHGRCMLMPGMSGTGKTGTAIQFANDIAEQQDEEFMIMSLEMDDAGVAERMAKIRYYEMNPQGNLYHSNLFFEQNRAVDGFYNKVMPDRMYICDKSNLSVHQIFNVAKYEISRRPKIKTLIIDYAQLINIYPMRPAEGLDEVSRVVARIGKELGVRVILLSQLTKDNYDGSKPTPASIKGSGGLFDNMDIVLCLYRNKEECNGTKLTFIHMKDRQNGSDGETDMHINGLHITSVDVGYFHKLFGEE